MKSSPLKNKVIIVTGGSGLLGRQIVNDLNDKGAIAINADIQAYTDLSNRMIHCDIRSVKSIKNTLKLVLAKYGKIDGLVNNGYPRTDDWGIDLLELPVTSLKKNIEWQLTSYILFCQQVIHEMLPNKYGTIVNIASIYGIVGNDFTIYEDTGICPPPTYSAIKGGLINFTRFLASKYGKDGIRVNSVSPGGIFQDQPNSFVKAYEKKVPLKRMGNPDDIAPAVAFLLSDEAKYITGHNLVVDGGWTAI